MHSTCGESGLGLSGAAKLPPAAADDRPPHGESHAEADETEGGRTQAGELAADDVGVPPLQAQEETVRGMPLGEVVSEPLGDVRCDSCEGEGGSGVQDEGMARCHTGGRALRTCGELGPGEKPDGLLLPSPYLGFSVASGKKTWRPRKRMSSSVAARLPSRSSSSSR